MVKMSILPIWIERFNIIPLKSQQDFLLYLMDKSTLKLTPTGKRTKIAKAILKKKIMFRSSPSHLSMNPRSAATGIQTVCTGGGKDTELRGRSREPQTDPHKCAPNWCSPNKAAKAIQWKKDGLFTNIIGEITHPQGKKRNLMNPILIKTISKRIMNLNVFVTLF